jgi:hypothetical protein
VGPAERCLTFCNLFFLSIVIVSVVVLSIVKSIKFTKHTIYLMGFKNFFNPSWKKLGWFFIVYFVAQLYSNVIMFFVPTQILQNFINFILNPGAVIITKLGGIEGNLALPIALTINVMWNYFLATILAKEISKEKE